MKRASLLILALGFFFFAQMARADWTPAKRLTWTSGWSWRPAIAVDSGDHIHIVWSDDTSGNHEIFYRKSTDGGTTWSAPKRLTTNWGTSENPSIAVDSSDTIHVVWEDSSTGYEEIFYRQTTDEGTTWSAAKRLTWTAGSSEVPDLAVDSSGAIHVAWQDDTPGNDEIFYKKSTDGGASWTSVKRLTWTSGASWRPDIAIGQGQAISAIWGDDTTAQYEYEIYYKRSTDGGASWDPVKRLTWTAGTSDGADMAIDSSNGVHIVWRNYSQGQGNLYYKQSTDGGTTWSSNKKLDWSGIPFAPALAIDSAKTIHLVWQDHKSGTYDLYYMKSTAGGTAWSTAQRLTWTAGDAYDARIAIDSTNTIHGVWWDDTPGNPEIYYIKSSK
jgi:hypothetical protein